MGENGGVAQPPYVKRYALVANDSNNGVRRFHLARVASPGRVPVPSRLERMEEITARERRRDEAGQVSQPGVD
jgi:hypothetical protein